MCIEMYIIIVFFQLNTLVNELFHKIKNALTIIYDHLSDKIADHKTFHFIITVSENW